MAQTPAQIARQTLAGSPARPFPQHSAYFSGTILPDHISRNRLDDQARSFYTAWKRHYIREGCHSQEYYIWFEGSESHKECVSEGQGYGMMIVAMMAGYDSIARETFDGLFNYYRAHPSKIDPNLMCWAQVKNCKDVDGTSASDGDMDIAYSLLLAYRQWGNEGPLHYLDEAKRIMSSILKEEINPATYTVLLSDAIEHDSKDYFDMRTSDFMPSHFAAFRIYSGDKAWDSVINNDYRLFNFMQRTYSPQAGLVPDFINKIKEHGAYGHPASAHYLESRYDGVYNFNACRVPWRIAMDYILHGDPRAQKFVEKINHWIRSTTQENPDNISAGYNLEGDDLKNRNYEALCFIGSFAISAMVGHENQPWLNKIWDYLVHFKMDDFDYYDNTLKMIDLIILSGNAWDPAK